MFWRQNLRLVEIDVTAKRAPRGQTFIERGAETTKLFAFYKSYIPGNVVANLTNHS